MDGAERISQKRQVARLGRLRSPPPIRRRASTPSLQTGNAVRLGATWDGAGVNFALFSAHATKVELCLFDDSGQKELHRVPLRECTDQVWHGYLEGGRPGLLYGYRVYGPYEPEAGHRFNPNKLLIDPYARKLVGPLLWGPEIFGYVLGDEQGDLSFDSRDSAAFVPKSCVVDPAFDWGGTIKPATPWDRTVIYEMHVRGFTRLDARIPEALRGTLAALASEPVVEHLKRLGITAVELLPIHAFVDDGPLIDKGLRNYWGYNSIGFFAPMPRYQAENGMDEFRKTVRRLHEAGIEVILDVVYNHTAEGNELGPTLSFKGIDNASYYRLAEDRRYYINDTGTGNTVALEEPRVLQLVADSLRYWADEMQVDGFRFDLATILGREPTGFDPRSGFLDVCRQDPCLAQVKLIAEPWDVGPGGYQLGHFPPGWAEWNDRFRDVVRSFWKGDFGQRGEFAARLSASADYFNHEARKPWASINFVTAHDGFTLADLVSYNDKHNDENGEHNNDGSNNNLSWNHGHEGPTPDENIVRLREQQKRNLIATLLFSQGTPMLVAGDEMGHTQRGNNNAYAQDNEISWLNPAAVTAEGHALQKYVERLIALRHAHPLLRQKRFVTGAYNRKARAKDVTWLNPDGSELSMEQWCDPGSRCLGMLLDERVSFPEPVDGRPREALLLLLNAHDGELDFTLPAGWRWRTLVSTSSEEPCEESAIGEPSFKLAARSLALLVTDFSPSGAAS